MIERGLNYTISNEDYHSEKHHLSSSKLKYLLTDLDKFHKEVVLGIKEEKAENTNFTEGSYVHSLILEPDKMDEYAFFDGWTKRGAEWVAFKEANVGKAILSKPQKVRCEKWHKAYTQNQAAVDLVTGIKAEVSLFTELEGVGVKVRCDGLNLEKGYILDVKTTSFPTDVDSFKLTADQFYYPLSAALYLRCFEEQFKIPLDFYFIVVGKTDNNCEVYKLSKETRFKGNMQVSEALKIYKHCMETNNWTKPEKRGSIDSEHEILEI